MLRTIRECLLWMFGRQGAPDDGDHHEWDKEWIDYWEIRRNGTWKRSFSPRFYYETLRKEIEREDNITNQRLTWSITFQGFLITAITFLLSQSWVVPPEVALFRKLSLLAIGVIGLVAGSITFLGVNASRAAIEAVKDDWIKINRHLKIVPNLAPRTYGRGESFFWGSSFAKLIPILFSLLWTVYIFFIFAVFGSPFHWNRQDFVPNDNSVIPAKVIEAGKPKDLFPIPEKPVAPITTQPDQK